MRDLHLRRVTETARAGKTETPKTDVQPEKALPWDNLALRERIAEAQVTHRSVTTELHTAARLAIDGRPTRSAKDHDTWSAELRETRPTPTPSRGTWSEEIRETRPTPTPSRGTWSEEIRGPRPIPAAPYHDPRPLPVQAPARQSWWKRLSDGLNLTGSAYRVP
jgi:hypothetical protein